MAENKKARSLYDALVKDGYKVGSYDSFMNNVEDEAKRKSLYDVVSKRYDVGDYDSFTTNLIAPDESPKMDARPQVPDVQVPEVAENPAPFTMDAKVKDYVLANRPDIFKSRSGNYATAPFTPGTEPLGELDERLRIAEEMRPTMIKEQNKGALRTLEDDVAALREDIKQKQADRRNERSRFATGNVVGSVYQASQRSNQPSIAEQQEIANVEYAEKMLDKSKRLLEEGENPSTSFIQGLGRGVADSLSDLDKWTMGLMDLANAATVKKVVYKIENNQPLTASEQAVMDAMVTNAATEMLYRDNLGRGYKAGEVTGESLPFMLDMIVGMGTIQAATKPLSKAMMKYAMDKLMSMGVKRNSIGMTVGRGVAHLGSGLKNVGLHTATFGAPRVAADYQERGLGQTEVGFDAAGNAMYQGQTGQESGLGAFGKSVISTAAETGSELLGEKFMPLLGFVGQATGLNRLTKIMPKQLGAFAKEIKANPGYKEAMKFAKAAKISDPISETMEEEVNNLVSVAIGDMSPEQLRDMDMHIDTFLGVAPVSVLFGGIGAGGYIRNKYKVNKELKGFERMMQEEYGEDWTEIRNALQNSTIEEARGFVKDILMRGDLPKDRKAQMVQYVYANMQEQALSAMDGQMSPEEIEANKKEIWNAYQLADKRLNFLSPEQKQSLDLMTIEEIDGLNMDEKQKQRMIDYKAAKADMDAYQLEMDARIQRAREQAMAQVEELTNFSTGTVMRVKSGYSENPIHIVRGNLTFNEDGTVDSSKSDKVIYYLDEQGAVKMGSINMIQELVDNTDATVLAEQAANDAQAEVQAQEVEETSPIDVEMTINTPDASYYIQSKNPDGSYIVNVTTPQGVQIDRMTEQQLQDLLTTQQAIQEEVNEVSAETTENAVTPQGEESNVPNSGADVLSNEQFEASLPKDKDGQLDFNVFTPQQAYEYTARTMGEDAAREDLQADLNNMQSEVNKLSEQVKKASGGARLQARQKLAQAQEQLSSLQEFYNSVVPQAETQAEVRAEEVQPTEFEDRDTYDTLSEINSSLSPEEVDAFVANRQKAFEDEIAKMEKKAPKIGTDINAYLEEKKAFDAEKQELQRKADYWKDIRAELDAMRTQVGEEEAMSVLEDMQPQNAEELAALFLTGMKLNRESYMKETGFGQEEARKMFGQFSKDGVTIDKAGELLENMAREEGYNFFPENEPNAGRNAILNVLSQVRTRGDLFKYLKDRREEQAKKLEEAARNAYENDIQKNFNMTVPEYEQYVEVAEREIKNRLMSEEDYADFMSVFADETLNEQKDGREETDNRGSETSGEVLSGEQSDIEGGNTEAEKSAEQTDGRSDNEGDTTQEDAVEQPPIKKQPDNLNNNELYGLDVINRESISYLKNYKDRFTGEIASRDNATINKGKIIEVGPAVQLTFDNDGIKSYRTIYGDIDSIKEWVRQFTGKGETEATQPTEAQQATQEAEVSTEQTDNIQPTESVLDYAKRVAEREEKKNKINLFKFTKKYDKLTKPALSGVFYKDGVITASDGYVVVQMEAEYPQENEGKILRKNGEEVKSYYPLRGKIESEGGLVVFPIDTKELKTQRDSLLKEIKTKYTEEGKRKWWEGHLDNVMVVLNIGDIQRSMTFKEFSSFVDAADMLDMRELNFDGIYIYGKNGNASMSTSVEVSVPEDAVGNITLSDIEIADDVLWEIKRIGVPLTDIEGLPKSEDGLYQIYAVKYPSGAIKYGVPREPKEVKNMDANYNFGNDRMFDTLEGAIEQEKVEREFYNDHLKGEEDIRFREDDQPIRRSIVDRTLNDLSINLTGEDFSRYPYEDRRTNPDVEGDIWYGYSEPQYKGVNAMDSEEVPERIKDILSDNEYEIDKADMVRTLENNIEFEGGYEEEGAQPYVEALNWLAENGDNLVMSDKVNLIIDAPSDDVRFREDDKNLLAVHNLSEESLQKAFDLGGFPMPSIAVTSKEIGHAEFGDISLVFDKETINPTNEQNRIYAGDAWTPVFPQVSIKINEAVAEKIRQKIKGLLEGTNYAREYSLHLDNTNMDDSINRAGNFRDAYKGNDAMKIAFLFNKGIDFKPVLIPKKFNSKVDNQTLKEIVKATGKSSSELMNYGYDETMALEPVVREVVSKHKKSELEKKLRDGILTDRTVALLTRDANRELSFSDLNSLFYDAYQYEKQGDIKIPDRVKTYDKLNKKFNKKLQQEFETWLDELSEGIIEKRGIRNERDMFTSSGNRRSWEALYDEITLDNVVRAMRAQSDKGGEGVFGGSIFGAAQQEVSSIDELKQIARERLAEIDADEYEAERDRITSRLSNLPIPGVSSSFGGTLDMIENITDAVKTSQTSSGIYKYLKKYYPKITKEITDEIADIVKDIQKLSTKYFEAKPYRAVGFEEVKLAVVPKGTSQEVIDKLEQFGIPVKTYKKGDEAARKRILNTAAKKQDLLFRFIGEQGAARLDAAEEATTRLDNLNVAREMEQAGKDAKAIKMATGWERGADGKWRYETADAKKIDLSGNVRWLKRHPEYARRRELNKKANSAAILGTEPLTEAEQTEYDELKRALPDVSLNETQINPDRMKLADIVDDDALFEAYPELANIDVKVSQLEDGNIASVATVGDLLGNEIRKELRINGSLYDNALRKNSKSDRLKLESAIEHEVQHLIQDKEGFASGGSIRDISMRNNMLYNREKIQNLLDEKYALHSSFMKSDAQDEILQEQFNQLLEKAMSDNITYDEAEKLYADEIYSAIAENYPEYKEYQDKISRIDEAIRQEEKKPVSVFSGYKRLAGEVEARNVQSRLGMTPEQRRSTLASETEDVAREDQIFLYDAMQADSRYITEDYKDVYVPEEYREHMDAPVKRDPAYDADTVFNYVYRMSAEYNRPMMEARKGILIPGTGEINIPAAQRLRDTARDILGRKKQALLDAMANSSMAARRYLMSIVNDIDDALKFFDELAEGKDVWRWKDPYYRNLGMRAENNPEIKKRGFAKHAREVASKLGVPVTVHHSLDSVPAGAAKNAIANGRKVKGWYDTKTQTIHVYMPNATALEDVEATILHEGVAHYGLRQLVGEENFDDFLDEVFANVSKNVRERILSNLPKYKYDARVATEEYMASLAESGVDTSTWNRIKQAFKELLRKVGINVKITDNELKYILWRSAQNLRMSNPLDLAQDVAMQYQMGVGNYLREGTTLFRDTDTAISDYNETFNKAGYWGREAWQDSMLSLKNLQEVVEEQSGSPIKEFENAYMAENQLSRLNKAQSFIFWDEYMKPLADELGRMVKSKIPYQDIADYMMLSHGIERNIEMTNRERVEAEYNKTEKTNKAQAEKDREDAYNKFYSDIKALRKQYKGYDYFKALIDYSPKAKDYSATVAILSRDGNAHTDFQTDALAKVKDFEDAHNVDELRKLTKKATDEILRKSFESGMMSRETYNRLKDMFAYYVPLRGWEGQTAEDVYDYMKDANPVNSALKRMEGRTTIPDDVFATIGNMGESAIVQGNRNMMKQKFYNMAVNHPTDLITLTKAWYVPNINGDMELSLPQIDATDDAETIAQKIKDHDELMRNTDGATQKKQGLNIDYPITASSKMQHAVIVKIGGKDYVMYVNGNPRAAQAVNGLTNPDAETNPALRATYWLNRQLSALYTSRNPEFVVSNFMRDYIEAGTVISAKEDADYNKVFRKNMRKSLADVIKGMRGTLKGQAGDYYKEFTENGGEMGFMTLSDVNAYKKKLKKQMDEITGRRGSAKKAFNYITDAVDAMNKYAETISRFATYRTSREMGRSIEQSIKDASDVTVNFSKKGSGFKALGGKMIKDGKVSTLAPKFFGMTAGTVKMLYLFINPAVQSLANWGYIAKHNKKALIGTVGAFALAGYVMPMVNDMLWNLFGGDDDKDNPYNDLPEWIRRNNLCIGVDKYLTIPLPHTLRAFYGIGEMSYQVSAGRKDMTPGEIAYETIGQVSALLPLDPLGNEGDIVKTLTPSYAKGIAEAYIWNEDFMGKPIAKATSFNELDPEWKRVYKGTAGWLVDTSKFFNDLTAGDEAGRDFRKGAIDFNPAKIEHIGESYFGGMWKFLNNSGKTLYYTGKSIVEGEKSDDLVLRNVPWVRKFVATVDERSAFSSINEEYFDLVDEMEQFDYEVKGVKKSIPQDPEKYTWQYEELMNSEKMKQYKVYEGYKGVLDYLYQVSKQLEGEEKDEIEMQIMGLRRELVEELRE